MNQTSSTGVYPGVAAWTAYAIVESLFAYVVPSLFLPFHSRPRFHLGTTLLLFLVYAALGSVLGRLCGWLLARARRSSVRLSQLNPSLALPSMATSTVLLTFALNLLVHGGSSSLNVLSVLLCLILLVFLAASAWSEYWAARLRLLTHPASACTVIVGLQWLIRTYLFGRSAAVKGSVALLYVTVVLLVTKLILKTAELRRERGHGLAHPAQRVVLLLVLALGVNELVHWSPWTRPLKSALPPGSPEPNVVLITLDTVRADHTSLYGYARDTTPNLKTFAEDATLYTQAIAAGDMTLSTHASLFTGLFASRHGAHADVDALRGRPLPESFETLAETLTDHGFVTIGIAANTGYLSPSFRLNQGFQHYDAREPSRFLERTKRYFLREGLRRILGVHSGPGLQETYRLAKSVNEEVFSQLERMHALQSPFFLFVNYMDAHRPYLPPPPFDERYPGKSEALTTARINGLMLDVLALKHRLTPTERAHLESQYDGEIAYLDANLGELIARLKKLGLYENSMIVITSDHGEAFGDRGYVSHGSSVYQDQIHVPLVIRYPGAGAGAVIEQAVSTVDLMPTILDVLGLEEPALLDGHSLLNARIPKDRSIIAESFPYGMAYDLHERFHRTERALFVNQLKFIASTTGKRELYSLAEDPGETDDLYASDDEPSIAMESRLSEWLGSVESSVERFEPDEETVERLRSLGYVE